MESGKKKYPLRLKHGLWIQRVDRKTKRLLNELINALMEDLNDPSNREKALIILTAPLIISCYRYGLSLLTDENTGSRLHYLAELGTIQRNLGAVGFKKMKDRKIIDLQSYLKSKEVTKNAT